MAQQVTALTILQSKFSHENLPIRWNETNAIKIRQKEMTPYQTGMMGWEPPV